MVRSETNPQRLCSSWHLSVVSTHSSVFWYSALLFLFAALNSRQQFPAKKRRKSSRNPLCAYCPPLNGWQMKAGMSRKCMGASCSYAKWMKLALCLLNGSVVTCLLTASPRRLKMSVLLFPLAPGDQNIRWYRLFVILQTNAQHWPKQQTRAH